LTAGDVSGIKAFVNGTRTKHPIRRVLRDQGRTQAWLARTIGFASPYVRAVVSGAFPASARFRAACAEALALPEGDLFVGHGASPRERGAPLTDGPHGSIGRARTAVDPSVLRDGEVSIRVSA
jgi:hypothetical protein